MALCTDGTRLLKSHDFLPFTDFFVARKMKDFLLSQYPINEVVILWVSTLAKRYVSNQATGCDSDSFFFSTFLHSNDVVVMLCFHAVGLLSKLLLIQKKKNRK